MIRFCFKPFIIVASLFFAFAFTSDPVQLESIVSKLRFYNQYRPQEKLYLHLDRPFYTAGDDMWFSSYLVDATSHRPDSISQVLYVELINSDRKVVNRQVLYSPQGIAQGDFHLPDTLSQGVYILRAYTNYMKNRGEDFFFQKKVSIFNYTDQTRDQPLESKGEIDLQFFPEGGNLLAGIDNRVAFKAVNQLGMSVSVEGNIYDELGRAVTSFKADHSGMGVVRFMVLTNTKYIAKISNVKSIDTVFPVSEVSEKGYLIRAVNTTNDIKITAFSNLKNFSAKKCIVYIIAQSRGQVCYAAVGEIINTSLTVLIPKSKLPSGITQVTLFDEQGIPQCERLIFVNHRDNLNVSVKPNQSTNGKRRKIEIDIRVNDYQGVGTEGFFSLSVFDKNEMKDQDIYPESIVSNLLLTSDLKGVVEDPGYYLKDTLPETMYHADLLMMTNGWRRFSWKDVLRDTLPSLEYLPELGLAISGTVQKAFSKRPSQHAEIKILSGHNQILILETDSLGRFYSDQLNYFDSTQLTIQTDNSKGKRVDLKFQLNPFNPSPPSSYFATTSFEAFNPQSFLEQVKVDYAQYAASEKVTLLKEVEIESEKLEDNNSTSTIYGTPDASIKMKDLPPQGYTSWLQILQGRVAGVNVSVDPPKIRIRAAKDEPLVLLNGVRVDLAWIGGLQPADIESIDVLKSENAAIYGVRGANGVIAIYTKNGQYSLNAYVSGMHVVKYPGFHKVRQFYAPRYDVAIADSNRPDIRHTLYWNPSIETNSDGTAHVSFFTSDLASDYNIIIEGVSVNGIPGKGASVMTVE